MGDNKMQEFDSYNPQLNPKREQRRITQIYNTREYSVRLLATFIFLFRYFEVLIFSFFFSKILCNESNILSILLMLVFLLIKLLRDIYVEVLGNMNKPLHLIYNGLHVFLSLIFVINYTNFLKEIIIIIMNDNFFINFSNIMEIGLVKFWAYKFIFSLVVFIIFFHLIYWFRDKIKICLKSKELLFRLWLNGIIIFQLITILLSTIHSAWYFYFILIISLYMIFEIRRFFQDIYYESSYKTVFIIYLNYFKLIFVLFILFRMHFEYLLHFFKVKDCVFNYIFGYEFYFYNSHSQGILNN